MKMRFAWLILVFSLRAACAFAQSDDGFGPANKIEGEHFTIYYKPGVDPQRLLEELKISSADEMLSGQSVDKSSVDRELSSMAEILFSRASDILDLHVYSYKGSIKIFPSLYELTNFYNKLYHAHVPCTGYAFYIVDNKSIYISAQFFHREILGHEIGHAIMSSYFVVQPSIKIQEVLAGYIEYQLRKSK
jgi:hypothetical protein